MHVNTEEQLADIFTKPLDEKRFCKLWCELNILESSNVLWLGTHPNTYACWWLRCATHEVKVYLQSMKTYILSVNTLMWNLTSERHDNCAPCLGLILPIRWVTPPQNSSVWSVLPMVLHLLCLLVESFELSECDRTLTLYAFYLKLYLSKSYAFYWNCRMSSLRPSQQKTQRQTSSPI